MNNVLRAFSLFVLIAVSLVACSKKDEPRTPTPPPSPVVPPTPPTPPAPSIHFTQDPLTVSLGGEATATLENFTGTLTQEGTVDGFSVTIKKNIVIIRPEKYLPGVHSFSFKGGDKTYTLKVILKRLREITDKYGVFTPDGERLLDIKYTAKKYVGGKIDWFFMANDQDNPRKGAYIQVRNVAIEGSQVSLGLVAHALQPISHGELPLTNGDHVGLKGLVVSEEGAESYRFFVTLEKGKHIEVVIPSK